MNIHAVVAIQLILSCGSLFASDKDLSKLKEIAAFIENRDQILQTLLIQYTKTEKFPDGNGSGMTTYVSNGIEMYKRNRSYVRESKRLEKESNYIYENILAWNGVSTFRYEILANLALISDQTEPGALPIKSVFSEMTLRDPDKAFHLEYSYDALRQMVSDVLFFRLKDDPLHVPGPEISENGVVAEMVGGHLKFTFSDQNKKPIQIVEFDPNHNFCPTRVTTYLRSMPIVKMEFGDIRDVAPGVSLPFYLKTTGYERGAEKINSEREIKIQKMEINEKRDDSEFTPVFKKGTQVTNKHTKKIYTVK